MPEVRIVSDSAHYMPPELAEQRRIVTVSLYVNENGGTTRELDITDPAAFYARLRTASRLPTTSQPAVADFLAAYEPLLADGADIVSIHLSSELSGTYEAARSAAVEARRLHPERRVEVVDTRSGAGGLAAVLLAATAVARAGHGIDAVRKHAEKAAGSIAMWFAVDTLEYLRRGGRIGAAQSLLGGALRVKPILTLDGSIKPVERVRTSARALERLVVKARELHAAGNDAWAVQHVQAPERAEELIDRCRSVFGCEPMFLGEVGPVIGLHTGPGLLGMGSLPAHFLEGTP